MIDPRSQLRELTSSEVLRIHCDLGYRLNLTQVIRSASGFDSRIAFSDAFLKYIVSRKGVSGIIGNIRRDYDKDTKYHKPTSLKGMKHIYMVTALNCWIYDHGIKISDIKEGQEKSGSGKSSTIGLVDYYDLANLLINLDNSIQITNNVLKYILEVF